MAVTDGSSGAGPGGANVNNLADALTTLAPQPDVSSFVAQNARGGGGQAGAYGEGVAQEQRGLYMLSTEANRSNANLGFTLSMDDFVVPVDAAGKAEAPAHFMEFPKDWPNKAYTRGDLSSYGRMSSTTSGSAAGSLMLLAAAQLAEAGRLDEAKRLLCDTLPAPSAMAPADAATAAAQAVAQTPAERLCGAINVPVPDAERLVAIRAAAQAATDDLLARRRTSMIVRKLAPDVFIQTPMAEKTRDEATKADEAAKRKAGAATVEFRIAEEKSKGIASLYVTILLADTSAKTIDALKALGVKVEAVRSEANVVVARVPLDKLEELALMDVVRRVELVPMTDETVK